MRTVTSLALIIVNRYNKIEEENETYIFVE